MQDFNVSVQFKEDHDAQGQEIASYIIQAKNKIQAVIFASRKSKKEIPDYSGIKHDLFYVVN